MRFPLFHILLLSWIGALQAEPSSIHTLWPEGGMPGPAPHTEGEERDLTKPTDKRIAGKPIIKLGHVSRPEAHVYLPPGDSANGAAVIVCPGGGFSILAWDLEGTEVARWLNELGIAAVVLKYRVPTREHGNEGDLAPLKALGPVMDAQRALSLTRAHAAKWNLDPSRIGILGFSAGGEAAALAALAKGERRYDPVGPLDEHSCTADFALLVYPGGLWDREKKQLKEPVAKQVAHDSPPMFFAHAADDRVTALSSTSLFAALKEAGVPAELHVYAKGGHGYGLRTTESPVTRWTNAAEEWFRTGGWLAPGKTHGEGLSGSPADHLPPWIRRLTWFGERPEWRSDGERVLFVSKVYGEIYEYEIRTGRIISLSDHFLHYGFTRAQYLANGDILLVGPGESFDRKDREDRKHARHEAGRMFLLRAPFDEAPHDLGVEVDEGPAVSRSRMKIAWTHGEQAEISAAMIVYEEDGTPRLEQTKKILDLSRFPEGTRLIETQNFVPPEDRILTLSAYQIAGSDDTDCFTFDLDSDELVNHTPSEGFYNEPEGIFPDGESTLVEHGSVEKSRWPLIDLYQLRLDSPGSLERLTHFTRFSGFKASQGVISEDGRQMIFQIGQSGDEAGQGYGFFLYDFELRDTFLRESLEEFGERQAADIQENKAIAQCSVQHPDITLEEAGIAQAAYVSALIESGRKFAGIKGAVVGEGGQRHFGIEGPLSAVLFRRGWHKVGPEKIRIPIRDGALPGVETELGIVLGRNIEAEISSIEELKSHVRAIVPVVELPAGKHDWNEPPQAIDLVAANVDSDSYIVGPETTDLTTDLDALKIQLFHGDEMVNETTGGDARGGQWSNFLHQVNWAVRAGYPLEAGHLVITGALGKIAKDGAGSYRADFGELGEISFELIHP